MYPTVRPGRVSRWLALVLAFMLVLVAFLLVQPAYAGGTTGDDPAASVGSVVPSTALWGLIVGVLTPPVVAIVQQPSWSTRTRSYVGVAVAVVFAVLTCLVDGSIGQGQTVLATIAAVLVASQTTYRELWRKIGVTGAIEHATSPGGAADNQADPPKPARKGARARN